MTKKALSAVCAVLFLLTMVGISYSLTVGIARTPKTGETTSYGTGSDGALQKGVAWPSPRFKDNGDGTVTDRLTGLIWLRNANCFGAETWTSALSSANNLASGSCGLKDSSIAGNWRLPTVNELQSLVNDQESDEGSWLNGQGFNNVQSNRYWSSTTYAPGTTYARYVYMYDGNVYQIPKTFNYYVWPVRGGQ